MNVRLHYPGIDAQVPAVFQAELDGGLDYSLVDGLHGGWGKSREGAVEGVVLGDAMAVDWQAGPLRLPAPRTNSPRESAPRPYLARPRSWRATGRPRNCGVTIPVMLR